mgnify:FL=1
MMKKTLLFLPILIFAYGLLRFPDIAGTAVQEGLTLCFRAIIPSLFPFFVVISLLLQMGFARQLQRLFSPFMGPLFHLSGVCAAPLLAGLVGGYPTGAKTVADLYSTGQISRPEAERSLAFVNNCGPAFLLSYVGAGVLGSSRAGVYLLLIHVAAALLSGLLLCRTAAPRTQTARPQRPPAPAKDASLAVAFPTAVTGALTSTLHICGFVVLFRVIAALLPGALPAPLLGFFEMVTGVAALSPGRPGFIAAAGIVGWGGLSVHCQAMAVLADTGLSLRRHWLGKGLQSLLSVLLALGVSLWLFP